MNKSYTKNYKFDGTYLLSAIGISLLLCGAYYWYHNAELKNQNHAANTINDAHRAYLQGMQLYREQQYERAAQFYEQALSLNPHHVQALTNFCLCHIRLGNIEEALSRIKHATDANTPYAPAYLVLGELYQRKNQNEAAKTAYEHAIALDQELMEARLLLAQMLTREGSTISCEKAIALARYVLDKQPNNRTALATLADAHLMAGNNTDARATYQKTLELSQDNADGLLTIIGKTYERELNFDKAKEFYQKAITANQNNAAAHVALAGALFATNELEKGFQEYEWRWHLSNMRNLTNKWDGSDIRDKRVFILGENGLGDVLQYVRFTQLMKAKGAYVMVHTPKPLVPLFKLCSYIDEVVPYGEGQPSYDVITSMQSIPALLHISNATLPNKSYVHADATLVKEWRTRLASDKNFKIGICWQPGDDSYLSAHQKRSISLEALAPLAQNKKISFYCLQKNTETIANAPFKIHDFGPSFDVEHGAFMDTAALMKNMDLIISVDTSVAHLAGALGVPTWILIPYSPDVRWMINRSDSIWYPNAKLYRQSKPGDWKSVIMTMNRDLMKKLK